MISLGIKEKNQTKSVHLFCFIHREFWRGWRDERKCRLCSCRSQMAWTLAIRCISRGQSVSLEIKLLFYLQLLSFDLGIASYPLLWEKNTNKERFGHNFRGNWMTIMMYSIWRYLHTHTIVFLSLKDFILLLCNPLIAQKWKDCQVKLNFITCISKLDIFHWQPLSSASKWREKHNMAAILHLATSI